MRYGLSLDEAVWTRLQNLEAPSNGVLLDPAYADWVPELRGVYMIVVEPGFRMERPLRYLAYAGKTESLRRRFREHCRGARGVRELKRVCRHLEFCFWVIDPGKSLYELEQSLLDAFGPAANRQNSSIQANLGTAINLSDLYEEVSR